ncbi:MAG: hypothetical protein JSS49_29775 [Planctomycetes bacterium]|nr:hypothetical protein [Planctomycetota bacterium]
MVLPIDSPDTSSPPASGNATSSGPSYDPTPAEWLWYFEWAAKHRPVAVVAAAHNRDFHQICVAIRRVAAWKRQEKLFDIDNFRIRQTETLENSALEALTLWDEKRDIRHLAETRRLLGDIRKLWGVGKPPPAVKADARTDGLARVAGIDRIEALRAQASQLMQVANELEKPDGDD